MRIIAIKRLKEFWQKSEYNDAEQPLKSWYYEGAKADWKSPHSVKEKYRSASILKNNRAVFNISGNKYRLVVKINYKYKIVYVRFIGTHQAYDKINAEKI